MLRERLSGFSSFRDARVWWALALGLGILLNLVQFPFIESRSGRLDSAINLEPDYDIIAQGVLSRSNDRSRYSVFLALGKLAPHSHYEVLIEGSPEHVRRRLYGFSLAESVVPSSTPLEDLIDFNPRPYIVASGPDGSRGPAWAIVLDPSSGVVGNASHPEDYLPDALREGTRREAEGGGRELLFIAWPYPPPESDYPYSYLVVEKSLVAGFGVRQ